MAKSGFIKTEAEIEGIARGGKILGDILHRTAARVRVRTGRGVLSVRCVVGFISVALQLTGRIR